MKIYNLIIFIIYFIVGIYFISIEFSEGVFAATFLFFIARLVIQLNSSDKK